MTVEKLFKTVWADHADMISIQYTGTGNSLPSFLVRIRHLLDFEGKN